MKQAKTNAMRLLERAGIPYTPHEYATDDGALDGISVADKTGQDRQKVYKTLVARGASGAVYVFCIPVAAELNLKLAAHAAGEKNIHMLPLAEITPTTGYVRGGCSPVGMKKQYPTFLHEAAMEQSAILVSGGRVGLQIEITPQNLQAATGLKTAVLCEE